MADELTKRAPGGSQIAAPGALDAHSKRAQVRSAERLAAALATIAGFTDAYGMITYGVFVSFMSGNTTQTGYQAAEGLFGAAALSAWRSCSSSSARSPGPCSCSPLAALRGGSCSARSQLGSP